MRHLLTFFALLLLVLYSFGCASASRGRDQRIRRPSTESAADAFPVARANHPASSLFFLNEVKGWLIVNGVLYGTDDAGTNWKIINRQALHNCTSITFASNATGWALCDFWNTPQRSNTILSTRDGGKSWQKILEVSSPIYSVDFINESVGFVSSRWLPLQRTNDGGKTWTLVDGIEGLHYLFFIDGKNGWGYGAAIWHTEDSGQTWTQMTGYEETTDLWEAEFPNPSSGWIVGKEQVWRLNNNSHTWSQVKGLSFKVAFLSVSFVNSIEGWITADDGSVFYTMDAGDSWQVVSKVPAPIRAVRFVNKNTGWGVTTNEDLIYSTDGGRSWVKKD